MYIIWYTQSTYYRPATRIFHWGGGGAYPNNWDQTINVGILGHASAKDTKVLGRFEDIIPWKNCEILHPPKAGNALKLSILLSPL